MRAGTPSLTVGDGFGLAELAAVVFILALLVATAFASYVMSVRCIRRAACQDNQRQMARSASRFCAEHSGACPASMDDLRAYCTDFERMSVCPEDGCALAYDRETGTVACAVPGH